ncbi:MAG: MATE family efflux transporter [Lachnospiraceae bacterium]|nr:MATE family efflux transporter [Lachnospiraceae bacterium]
MKDLTKGYPAKVIMMFAIPLMFGYIFQQFYNMADSKIVSTYVGTNALAAVGATAVVFNTMIFFVNGLTQGFSILIANSFGAKDMQGLRRYVAGSIVYTVSVTAIMTVAGLVFIVPILELLQTPPEIMEAATSYVRIIIAGMATSSLYNMCANTLRAVGDSKNPLYCLLVAVIVNIALDLLFVRDFKMGIEGAAYATVIAQALSGLMCLTIILFKFKEILPRKADWKFEKERYRNLFTTGLSMALMGCIVNIGTIVLQGAINELGTDIVAAHTASRRVFDVMTVMLYTVGIAMTTYASQNMGAGKPLRVRQGVRHANLIVTGITTLLIVFCYVLGEPLLIWITATGNSTIIDASVMYLELSVWFFYVLGPLFVMRCTLQGMGRKIIPLFSSFMEMVVKVLSAGFLVPAFAYVGVALTEPISWIVMIIPLLVAYFVKPPEKMLDAEESVGENE